MCLDPAHHVGQWGRGGGGPMFSGKKGMGTEGGIQRDKILKLIAIARACATFHPPYLLIGGQYEFPQPYSKLIHCTNLYF